MPNRPSDQAEGAKPGSTDRPVALGSPKNAVEFPVVGIGASAGGLDACRKLLSALPPGSGIACILVQHLDPTHESMMADLLADYTTMVVQQAAEGVLIEPDHLYIIPPGTYLSVANGMLRLSQPRERHGARLPFDFLLHSMAADLGPRAACVVLSGTGADGSLGLKAVKARGGLVIAQEPEEAGYSGMPKSAIMTSDVDFVLPVAEIPNALLRAGAAPSAIVDASCDWLAEIIPLLRNNTGHDFSLYKPGTLQRRIERRMAMATGGVTDGRRYIKMLETDAAELNLLAKDMLINVTGFFRDPEVFEFVSTKIIPDLVRSHVADRPIRIWIAGCSTGEETYSLVMLFRDEVTAAKLDIKIQVFASDVDSNAIATAREGLYPTTIEESVSAQHLARFFSKEDHGYRVTPDLRAAVVFTVQDVLADPPFSRLDFVSCRNLLIYLRPEAQEKVLALFHFALEPGGVLLLGTSETIGSNNDRFEVISKPQRIYRRAGCSRPGEVAFARAIGDGGRFVRRPGQRSVPSQQAALGDLWRQMVLEAYAPAAVLINLKNECLYSIGPTDRYVRVVPGLPSHDLLAMARQGLRTKLRSAIQQAGQQDAPVITAGGRIKEEGHAGSFKISVRPIRSDGERLLLVCFVDDPKPELTTRRRVGGEDGLRVAELESELEATRAELEGAIHNLEISGEEQKAINEEALSVQEEYQSTNEELLTSKEELQSLNEELTALNSQLQETLERQRTTSDDLQNVLYSTDVATLFLDQNLNIRFFTPATKSLFAIIPTDLGRPLSDLNLLAVDADLLADAGTVLRTLESIGREIEAGNGACYARRVLPYRTQNNGVQGVVITFADITDRRKASDALNVAKGQAELANAAKSRFLAAASHDLRQPLQTLALVHGLLAKNVESEKARNLVSRMDQTLGAMSGMLNALLDINQIEAGTVQPEITDFPVNDMLEQLRDEFSYHAQAKGLSLRVIPCSLSIHSNRRLLEQMIRNLLSNAMKYTAHGKVLIGCRRHCETLSIEVWDTGIGIAETELKAIFDEYHQIDNAARERSRGLGLGLSIVHRLGALLGHPVDVHSRPAKGSVFAIRVGLKAHGTHVANRQYTADGAEEGIDGVNRLGQILVIEDDPDVRELLVAFLRDAGHEVASVSDGTAALEVAKRGVMGPDLILADYDLPNGLDGARTTILVRGEMHRQVPAIILTGDISSGVLSKITLQDCIQLTKPVKLRELTRAIQRLLQLSLNATHVRPRRPPDDQLESGAPTIFVVDDDDGVRSAMRGVLEDDGRAVEDFASGESFLQSFRPGREACLVIDGYLPGMNGLELLCRLHDEGHHLPAIMITGKSDVPMAVQAMKAGASDFIEKPISRDELLASVDRALEQSRDSSKRSAWRQDAAKHVAGLTPRQRQIMEMVLAGQPSKNIAADLGISQRTVENHRASIMIKTGSKSLPALARLALAAAANDSREASG